MDLGDRISEICFGSSRYVFIFESTLQKFLLYYSNYLIINCHLLIKVSDY